jgi:hypothetical protein
MTILQRGNQIFVPRIPASPPDAVVVADGAADPHQAAPDRPGIAFTYVTDGGLTSPLELKRYRLFHARLGSISSEPFAREKQK